MTSALLLLPTQEALVQRLQHTASYSGQLLLLSGLKGSGKSTLSLALASELDEHNSALVLCPLHADPAEIRRKILVQLISSPIFDDEMPLMDTVMRIQSTLTKPLHIIIDDAHLLPKSLWAECILLSQMRCAGANIAVTMAIDSEYLTKVMAELSEEMQQMLLPISIEPLPIAERDGLYQSLLLRSGCTPFIPRSIIHQQLEKQSGTPEEVVELLNLAIAEPKDAPTKGAKMLKFAIAMISLLIVGGTVYGVLNSSVFKANNEPLKSDTVRIANEELEYEIIIIDGGFTSWFNTFARPRGFYSQSYLEIRNQFWVQEWNYRVNRSPQQNSIYDWPINYDSSVNYGYEVNYMLYNYLVYFQLKNKTKLGGFTPRI